MCKTVLSSTLLRDDTFCKFSKISVIFSISCVNKWQSRGRLFKRRRGIAYYVSGMPGSC